MGADRRLHAHHGEVAHEVRLLNLAEETGETAAALIGMNGWNRRKGTCATRDDVLADVIITAAVAMAGIARGPEDARRHFGEALTPTAPDRQPWQQRPDTSPAVCARGPQADRAGHPALSGQPQPTAALCRSAATSHPASDPATTWAGQRPAPTAGNR